MKSAVVSSKPNPGPIRTALAAPQAFRQDIGRIPRNDSDLVRQKYPSGFRECSGESRVQRSGDGQRHQTGARPIGSLASKNSSTRVIDGPRDDQRRAKCPFVGVGWAFGNRCRNKVLVGDVDSDGLECTEAKGQPDVDHTYIADEIVGRQLQQSLLDRGHRDGQVSSQSLHGDFAGVAIHARWTINRYDVGLVRQIVENVLDGGEH